MCYWIHLSLYSLESNEGNGHCILLQTAYSSVRGPPFLVIFVDGITVQHEANNEVNLNTVRI
jgi:hypothetical protein